MIGRKEQVDGTKTKSGPERKNLLYSQWTVSSPTLYLFRPAIPIMSYNRSTSCHASDDALTASITPWAAQALRMYFRPRFTDARSSLDRTRLTTDCSLFLSSFLIHQATNRLLTTLFTTLITTHLITLIDIFFTAITTTSHSSTNP